ncbi:MULTISPECIES: hypothetical protein [Haloferax]|uniref:Uncharacterized protein n=2 Tax=Haloferax TaxID=2251 RepID=A0A6G1Z5M5_9EURY|nr:MULTISPECIES: hypothetical protein [Haloferax]KAB1185674.1 hypothetical protein Hfx1149_14655 [Haloferax sp. CBA1149]KAB1185828.1 hypothetical protein Hfx1149_14510 [Haloferax sp. CBA1149]KAB1186895.1 hypothetical protein Hfx1149_02170 [Haloferax sp. CBA1149]KAB1187794.1 hypothetical protein Hfx1149_07005 [Haloferax sp. CBA1149]MRW79525.1 hypothetical protein [Haloferax marinisediminis]
MVTLPTIVAQSSSSASLPDSTIIGVAASFVSAFLVYSARQVWERKKLKRALLTEVGQMTGITDCANQMARLSKRPPGRQLQPDDMPSPDSIPTTVYEASAVNIGLLGGVFRGSELENAVDFYSKVTKYKGVIQRISESENVSEEIPDTVQEDLYDNIGELEETRAEIVSRSKFVEG